jgi:hypothetical protein
MEKEDRMTIRLFPGNFHGNPAAIGRPHNLH